MRRGAGHRALVDRIAGDCIAVRVRLIYRVVSSVYAEALRSLRIGLDSGPSRIYNFVMRRGAGHRALVDRIAGDCIAVRVRLINRVVTSVYDEALRPLGIRVSQGNVLVAVARKGEARPAEVCR